MFFVDVWCVCDDYTAPEVDPVCVNLEMPHFGTFVGWRVWDISVGVVVLCFV